VRLDFLCWTPGMEALIATAMLTTTSGAQPSTLFKRLEGDEDRVWGVVSKIEAQHGSVLEHNRLDWLLEASEREVLDLLLRWRYFNVSKLGSDRWLLSANLRTVIEYVSEIKDDLSRMLMESMMLVAPALHDFIWRLQI